MALRLTLFEHERLVDPLDHSANREWLEEVVRRAVAAALETPGEPKVYFTLKEAAAHLTISASQLRDQVAAGEIPPPVTVAGCKRYTREQLDGIRRTAMIQAGFRNF